MPVAQTITNFAGLGIDREIAEPEGHENIQIGNKAKHTRLERHAVVPNFNRIGVDLSQAGSEVAC